MSAVLLALALSACGGGNASHALPSTVTATAAPSAAAQGTAKFSLLIPNSTRTSALSRRAQYVSASTLSGTIMAGAGPATELDLSAGSPLCTTVSNGRSCNIAAPASIGSNVSFSVKLFDGMFAGGMHHGTLLSSASFTSNVTEGAANVSVPLILAGALASYKVVVTQQPAMYDTTSVGTAILDAYDADSNLIVGSGTFTLANGTAESVGLTPIPSGKLTFSLNGGAYAPFVSITGPGEAIAFKQTADIIGAQILASVPTLFPLTAAWVRPTGFSSQFVEGTLISSSGTNQIAPLVDVSEGVAVVAESAPGGGLFTSNAGSVTNAQCTLPIAPAGDFAYVGGVAWMPAYSTDGANPRLFTFAGSGTCSGGPQFVADTDIGISGVGVEFINYDGASTCQVGTMVPGVFQNLGSAVANCGSPHDLVVTRNLSGYVALETDTFGGNDHVLGFGGTSLLFNQLVTHGGTTAAGGSLVSEAMRSDDIAFMHELANNRLWSVSWDTYLVNGFVTLPASYTYVNHQNSNNGHAYSTRTIAIGNDGLAYIAISSPVNGLLVVDPDTGAALNVLPNVSGASGSTVQQVVADGRGSIYWSAGVYLMHFPSGLP